MGESLTLRCNKRPKKNIFDKTAEFFIYLINSNCSERVIYCQNVQNMVTILQNWRKKLENLILSTRVSAVVNYFNEGRAYLS